MKTITLKRVSHKGEKRLLLEFQFDSKLIELVRKIKGNRWSKTLNSWHIPDNEVTLKETLLIFKDIARTDISLIVSDQQKITAKPATSKEEPRIYDDMSYITGGVTTINRRSGKLDSVEFTIDESGDKLHIRFTGRYDKEWIKELKSYGKAEYNPVNKDWILSWSRIKVDSLSDYFSSRGIEVVVKKRELPLNLKENREELLAELSMKEIRADTMKGIENVRKFLISKRYSVNTVEAYLSMLQVFFRYFSDTDPAEITEEDINTFFSDHILSNKYSASYHNQLISAIKIFYSLNKARQFDSSSIGRPRRTRALPKVFSKEEVKSILNSTRNTKHRLILWMIYSCGLRRSEVINIKVLDLDRDRRILNIREAKGMKDRFVPVSEKVWEKIDEYIDVYHPDVWLFEGQTGGKYSSESVYRIFKQSLLSAGIKKDVGVHSLRHSYATHLHENGLDIRYIQELLGHRSTRTTEIYTHVSRRNLIQVRSPIDDLDVR